MMEIKIECLTRIPCHTFYFLLLMPYPTPVFQWSRFLKIPAQPRFTFKKARLEKGGGGVRH